MKFPLLISFLLVSLTANAGLDISAYEGLSIDKSPKKKSAEEHTRTNDVTFEPVEFPDRFAGLQKGVTYHYKAIFEFRAGSYSGYNEWRNELAKLAGYETTPYTFNGKTEARYDATVWKIEKGPFWEFIDFSDAEGVIGPQACQRIYADFVKYRSLAKLHYDAFFRNSYEDWFKAFSMCANNGAIVFH
jgi:hypothetical protein